MSLPISWARDLDCWSLQLCWGILEAKALEPGRLQMELAGSFEVLSRTGEAWEVRRLFPWVPRRRDVSVIL